MLHFRHNLRIPSLVAATAIAFAPAAFAQDATTDTQHRFAVVGGYAHMVPKSNPGDVLGSKADLDGSGAPTLSGSWYVNDNFAVELWGAAAKFENDVNLANGSHGTIKQQPVAVSGQYHFGAPTQPIRPYVGLGYYQSNVDSEQFDPALTGGSHVGIGTPDGPIATAGVDFNITDRWFARADARYMKGDADVNVAGQKVGDVALDPWVIGVGVGTRF
jgi:outer membrane protein